MNSISNVLSELQSYGLESLRGVWDVTVSELMGKVTNHLSLPQVQRAEHPLHWLERATAPVLRQKAQGAQFFVVSSMASGGKSTTGKILESQGVYRMPRVTTRKPRPGESDKDYEFLSPSQFSEDASRGRFLYVEDGRIAVRKSTFDSFLSQGKLFYCEGDPLAFGGLKEDEYAGINYAAFFISPDSLETALARLFMRIRTDIERGALTEESALRSDVLERISKIPFHLRNSGDYFTRGIYHGYLVNDTLEGLKKKIVDLI